MSQEEYWKTKWDERGIESPNNFARRCFSQIKNKDFKTLLDIGCGAGRDSLYFARNGLNVTAIDFSEGGHVKLRKFIEEKNIKNITPILRDIRKIDFKDNSFDVIYAHLSLHYFDDATTTQIFGELYRILKSEGLIFIKCKSTEDELCGQGERVGENMYVKGHLRHFFSKEYMKAKLEKFKILKIRKTSSVYHQYKSAFIEAVATK